MAKDQNEQKTTMLRMSNNNNELAAQFKKTENSHTVKNNKERQNLSSIVKQKTKVNRDWNCFKIFKPGSCFNIEKH